MIPEQRQTKNHFKCWHNANKTNENNKIFKITLFFCFSTESIISGIQLTLTIKIHLIRERPNPEMAPYLPAAEVVRQKDRKNPIQLKRNATVKAERKKISDMSYYPGARVCPLTCFCLNGFPKDKREPNLPSTTLTHSPKATKKTSSLNIRWYTIIATAVHF